MSSPLLDFFREFFNRLSERSPKFFRILQLIFACLAVANYIPSMLQRWFNVEVPGHFITLCEDIAKYCTGFFAASFLPVQQKPVAQTEEGKAIIVSDEKKLPFTAKAQEQVVEDQEPPPPVKSNIPEQPNP